MSSEPGYLIRQLQLQDASRAQSFTRENGDGTLGVSLQFCYQHASGIFVCYNQKDEWVGIIISYHSPNHRGSASIETVVVAPAWRRKGIASLLVDFVLDFWKDKCVFRLSCMPDALSEPGKSLLQKFGFKPLEKDGFTLYQLKLLPEKICVHNRVMRPSMNTINGEVSEDTLFEYYQKEDIVWGTYSGGNVVRGVLLGKMARNGDIDFEYKQLSTNGEFYGGTSKSSTEFLNDGRIVLYEDWEWTGNRSGGGRSVIEEIKEV